MASSSDVTAKRILAWLIDGVLLFAILAGVGTALGRSGTFPNADDAQLYCDRQTDLGADVVCVNVGSSVFEWDAGPFVMLMGIGLLIAVVNHVVLQGISGATVGKRVTGLRVVDDATSQLADMKAAIIRFVLWIVDGLPGIIPVPLVGGILMLTSDKNQRLGDRLAKTRVVSAGHVGATSDAPMSPAHVGLDWAQPMPGEPLEDTTTFNPPAAAPVTPPVTPPGPPATPAPAAPPVQPETTWAPPTPQQKYEPDPTLQMQMPEQPAPQPAPEPYPAPEPQAAPAPFPAPEPQASWDEPTTAMPVPAPAPEPEPEPAPEPEPEPSPAPQPEAAPEPEPAPQPAPAPAPQPAPEPAPVQETRPGIDAPMWDEARGTHIQWDPKLQKWMGWDQAESRWKPL